MRQGGKEIHGSRQGEKKACLSPPLFRQKKFIHFPREMVVRQPCITKRLTKSAGAPELHLKGLQARTLLVQLASCKIEGTVVEGPAGFFCTILRNTAEGWKLVACKVCSKVRIGGSQFPPTFFLGI